MINREVKLVRLSECNDYMTLNDIRNCLAKNRTQDRKNGNIFFIHVVGAENGISITTVGELASYDFVTAVEFTTADNVVVILRMGAHGRWYINNFYELRKPVAAKKSDKVAELKNQLALVQKEVEKLSKMIEKLS